MANHAVVIPLFGVLTPGLRTFVHQLRGGGLQVVLVDNNPVPLQSASELDCECYLHNANVGGIAGAFNRGIEEAIRIEADWVTLLDQDSRLEPSALHELRAACEQCSQDRMVVGPTIWDCDRSAPHDRHRSFLRSSLLPGGPWLPTRLLISSGTTFQTCHWSELGSFCESLFIDYVDHAWAFRAQAYGFRFFRHADVWLRQAFGEPHPNPLCRSIGMQLYSPIRHYYSIRNLRWLLLQSFVPLDIRIKEFLKMLFKPWFWIFFEPCRVQNCRSIVRGLTSILPSCDQI